jgi:hypothetical protein
MENNNDAIFVGAKIPKNLHKKLERAAQIDFRSMSKTLVVLLAEALEAREIKNAQKKV